MGGKMFRNEMVTEAQALPGRDESVQITAKHLFMQRVITPPFPPNLEQVVFGMGCFWGAERLFWQQPGVYVTAVGYCGGYTPNPSYEEVCSGLTGHAEGVLVVYDHDEVTFETLMALFWSRHDPTQGMRQGNDIGTQYRSAIYYYNDHQRDVALQMREQYQQQLSEKGLGAITTEIAPVGHFYYAEPYHQQYLISHPGGYCGLAGCGVEYSADD